YPTQGPSQPAGAPRPPFHARAHTAPGRGAEGVPCWSSPRVTLRTVEKVNDRPRNRRIVNGLVIRTLADLPIQLCKFARPPTQLWRRCLDPESRIRHARQFIKLDLAPPANRARHCIEYGPQNRRLGGSERSPEFGFRRALPVSYLIP